jgi:hypothetical protein
MDYLSALVPLSVFPEAWLTIAEECSLLVFF